MAQGTRRYGLGWWGQGRSLIGVGAGLIVASVVLLLIRDFIWWGRLGFLIVGFTIVADERFTRHRSR